MADGGLQPVASERPVWWHVFKERCTALEADSRRTVERLIQHLETGWAHVIELQLACERQRMVNQREAGGRVLQLVDFVEVEVIATFGVCAEGAAAFLVRTPAQAAVTSDELGRIAENFERAVAVSALASEAAQVPPDFRSVVLPAADALVDWSADYCTLIAAAAVPSR